MKKVLIGDTLYNQVYLIHLNNTKGATQSVLNGYVKFLMVKRQSKSERSTKGDVEE